VSGSLSYGFQKQLELGIALASEPELLLLDEPTAGMSAQETHQTIELIGRITREKGLTLLFTEHDMEVVFSISARIMVLHQGRLIAEGLRRRSGTTRTSRKSTWGGAMILEVSNIYTSYG